MKKLFKSLKIGMLDISIQAVVILQNVRVAVAVAVACNPTLTLYTRKRQITGGSIRGMLFGGGATYTTTTKLDISFLMSKTVSKTADFTSLKPPWICTTAQINIKLTSCKMQV